MATEGDDEVNNLGPSDPRGVHLPVDADDQIYPESRFDSGTSPTVIYIPSRDVMSKMMRACIGVTDPKDLWIFNPQPE